MLDAAFLVFLACPIDPKQEKGKFWITQLELTLEGEFSKNVLLVDVREPNKSCSKVSIDVSSCTLDTTRCFRRFMKALQCDKAKGLIRRKAHNIIVINSVTYY